MLPGGTSTSSSAVYQAVPLIELVLDVPGVGWSVEFHLDTTWLQGTPTCRDGTRHSIQD